jgi:outer membrane immunogenic protein
MKRVHIQLLAAAVTLGFGQYALAADMLAKTPAYTTATPATPVYNWTGFYVGANAGYGWKDPTVAFNPNDATAAGFTCGGFFGGTCPPATSFNIHGALGGLQVGYNWQFDRQWLLGFETDFDWSRIQGAGTSNFFLTPALAAPGNANFQAIQDIKWFGTVRARLGFLLTNNFLVYATGGFAYGRVDENVTLNASPGAASAPGPFTFTCAPAGSNCFLGNSSRAATGWTAGAGLEYVLWGNVSVKAEYLYTDLGSNSVNVVAQKISVAGTNPSSFTATYSALNFNEIRAGLNYKF